jgi:U3 small nucleolar RNA-associated protein 25
MLVSERFHFYKRYAIRGVKRIIWFAPPTHEETFLQWSVLCVTGDNTKRSMCIISPEDYLAAERLLGSKRIMDLFK